jgi:hypothetical protein
MDTESVGISLCSEDDRELQALASKSRLAKNSVEEFIGFDNMIGGALKRQS